MPYSCLQDAVYRLRGLSWTPPITTTVVVLADGSWRRSFGIVLADKLDTSTIHVGACK